MSRPVRLSRSILIFAIFIYSGFIQSCKSSQNTSSSILNASTLEKAIETGVPASTIFLDIKDTEIKSQLSSLTDNIVSNSIFNPDKAYALDKTFEINRLEKISNASAELSDKQIRSRSFQSITLSPGAIQKSVFKVNLSGEIICSSVYKQNPCPQLDQLPITLTNAKIMKPGDFVTLPMEGSFLIPVTGRTLRTMAKSNYKLKNLYSITETHSLTNTISGHILVSGNLKLTVIREKNYVRLIVGYGKDYTLKGKIKGRSSHVVNAVFIPVTYIQKIKHLQRTGLLKLPSQIRFLKRKIENISSKAELVAKFMGAEKLSSSSKVPRNIAPIIGKGEKDIQRLANFVVKTGDFAANKIEMAQKAADKIIKERTNNLAGPYKVVAGILSDYANKTLGLDASIDIGGSFQKGFTILKDFSFDLQNPLSELAYTTAVTGVGKIALEKHQQQKLEQLSELNTHHDFTVVENIALSESTKTDPAIKINDLFYSDLSKSSAKLSFNGFKTNRSFENIWSEEKISAYDTANKSFYNFHVKSNLFKKGSINKHVSNSDVRISKITSKESANHNLISYSKNYTFPIRSSSKIESSIAQFINVTGRFGIDSGIQNLYVGSNDRIKGYELNFGLKKDALARLLDSSITTVPVMWNAFEKMSTDYNNTFGLPFVDFGIYSGSNKYADFGISDSDYPETKNSGLSNFLAKKCDGIRKTFGNSRCRWFANEFTYNLIKQQKAGFNIESLTEFLTKQARQKNLANTASADFIFRLVSEILYEGLPNQTVDNRPLFFLRAKLIGPEEIPLYFKPEVIVGDEDYSWLFTGMR